MRSNLLQHTRCYLSGPMDFVGSRLVEKYLGWRAILTPILKSLSITVLDPWSYEDNRYVFSRMDGYGDLAFASTAYGRYLFSQHERFWTWFRHDEITQKAITRRQEGGARAEEDTPRPSTMPSLHEVRNSAVASPVRLCLIPECFAPVRSSR